MTLDDSTLTVASAGFLAVLLVAGGWWLHAGRLAREVARLGRALMASEEVVKMLRVDVEARQRANELQSKVLADVGRQISVGRTAKQQRREMEQIRKVAKGKR